MALKSRFEQQIRLPVLPSWAWKREQLKIRERRCYLEIISGPGHCWISHVSEWWSSMCTHQLLLTLWWRVTLHGPFCSQAHAKSSNRPLPGSPGLRRRIAPVRDVMGFVMTKVSSTAPAKSKPSGHSLDEVFSHEEICSPQSQLQTAHTLPLFPKVHAA